jgi:hypothetical protein
MKYFLLTIIIIAMLDSFALLYFTVVLLNPSVYVITFVSFVSAFTVCLLVFHIKELRAGSR